MFDQNPWTRWVATILLGGVLGLGWARMSNASVITVHQPSSTVCTRILGGGILCSDTVSDQMELLGGLALMTDDAGDSVGMADGEVDIGTAKLGGIVFLNDGTGNSDSDSINMTPGGILIGDNDGGGVFVSGTVITAFGTVVGQNGVQPGSGFGGALPTCTAGLLGAMFFEGGSPGKFCICTNGPAYCSLKMSNAAAVVCAGGSSTTCP